MLYPILIKPRTQVHRGRKDKGAVAYSSVELIEKYRTFLDREYLTTESPELPESMVPLLQHFVDTRVEGVCSVSGYIDETGELFVARRARKILQRSLPAGVGVCFESLGPDEELSDNVRRLCKNLGYFGIFEVEFIRSTAGWAVIDFNPRLFSQTGMDALRGMPLAQMAYLDATGQIAELRLLVEKAQEEKNPEAVFFDRFTLWAILTVKTLLRRTAHDERKYWSDWRKQHRSHSVDFAAAAGDAAPGIVHVLSEINSGLRSLRRFFRATHQALPHAQHVAPKEQA
jgi:predicted ATP-grasp superfamily ATP-dependent carboligase